MDLIGTGLFFLQWWGVSLIIIGLVLTVLIGSIMILWVGRQAYKQAKLWAKLLIHD